MGYEMHRKNIRRIVAKELKGNFPNWRSLNRKKKKEVAREIVEQVVNGYDFGEELGIPVEELTGIEGQVPTAGVMDLDEMVKFIDSIQRSNLFDLRNVKRKFSNIKDEELKFVDSLLDDHIINRLLSYEGYSPCMRDVYPSSFFRAELLKAIKYPEISYRKFCQEEYIGLDRKQNREFIGLPLHKKQMIHHTQLSQFRTSMTFPQMMNLLVYVLSHFFKSGVLSHRVLHGVDSTELPNDNTRPLCSVNVDGEKIRIYTDIDSDCGKRRNKRDKSSYFIGYRMHTLTAIDAKTGHSFPLVSLLAAGNHHDSLFLKPLIKLAQSMGVEVKLITADEAYHDKDGSLFEETGICLITPPSSQCDTPDNVCPETLAVTCDDMCHIPMIYMGCVDEGHEFKCGAEPGQCSRAVCSQCRTVPFDNGNFQRIPMVCKYANEAIEIRKNSERLFNLLKHREGLEPVRVRSQHSLIARCTFSNIATLLLEMAGTRKKNKKDNSQVELFDMAA
jgi:hypothetical protein